MPLNRKSPPISTIETKASYYQKFPTILPPSSSSKRKQKGCTVKCRVSQVLQTRHQNKVGKMENIEACCLSGSLAQLIPRKIKA
ncbi:hypothetical protein EYC84_011594 [Monilinia fructicola]|uniref:Uncharacterized protein n=1 Tax=Monilinia fructicola TaxID=38448 RepID=A0A5M9JA04_MONFR|nr:hypothetical protein EYC84_011594 [Monilinia fructicola]